MVIPLETDPASGNFVAPTSVSFASGDQTATATVVASTDDNFDNETVALSFGTLPNGVSEGTQATTTITLADAGPTDLALDASAITVTEGSTAALTVSLSSASPETVTFTWFTADGTAEAGTDYTPQASTAVSFAPNETSKTLYIPTLDDTTVEPNETLTVSITAPNLPAGVVLGTAQATVTITSDDTATLAISAATTTAREGSPASLSVSLSRAVSETVTFSWSTADGTAEAGTDYTPQASTAVSFAPNETSKTLYIPTVDDTTVEPNKTFTVSITAPKLPAGVVLGTAQATVTITSDDTATLAISAATTTAREGSPASLSVSLSRAVSETVTFTWSTADGTAEAGTDYTAQPSTPVSFAPGETSKTLSVATHADFNPELDETFHVTLAADVLPAGVSLGVAVAIVTIQDGDDAIGAPLTLRILEDDLAAVEGGPPIDLEFLLDPPADRPVAIPLLASPLRGLTTLDHPPLPRPSPSNPNKGAQPPPSSPWPIATTIPTRPSW